MWNLSLLSSDSVILLCLVSFILLDLFWFSRMNSTLLEVSVHICFADVIVAGWFFYENIHGLFDFSEILCRFNNILYYIIVILPNHNALLFYVSNIIFNHFSENIRYCHNIIWLHVRVQSFKSLWLCVSIGVLNVLLIVMFIFYYEVTHHLN